MIKFVKLLSGGLLAGCLISTSAFAAHVTSVDCHTSKGWADGKRRCFNQLKCKAGYRKISTDCRNMKFYCSCVPIAKKKIIHRNYRKMHRPYGY